MYLEIFLVWVHESNNTRRNIITSIRTKKIAIDAAITPPINRRTSINPNSKTGLENIVISLDFANIDFAINENTMDTTTKTTVKNISTNDFLHFILYLL